MEATDFKKHSDFFMIILLSIMIILLSMTSFCNVMRQLVDHVQDVVFTVFTDRMTNNGSRWTFQIGHLLLEMIILM